jgi:hypothetical protein
MEGMQGGDAWAATGDNDITATVSGPIGSNIRFFGAVRKTHTDNWSQNSRWFTPFSINEGNPIADKIGGLTNSGDMVVLSTAGNYVFRDVDGDGVYTAPVTDADGVVTGDEAMMRGNNSGYAFDNEEDNLSLNGSLQWDMNPLVIRIGGAFNSYTNSSAGLPIQGMFNTRRHENAGSNFLLNVKTTYFLNTSTYIRANFSTVSNKTESYDKMFKEKGVFKDGQTSTLSDWLKFGDRDAVAGVDSNWAQHFGTPGGDPTSDIYRFVEPSNYNVNGFRFQRDGARRGGYSKGEDGYINFNGEFVTQMGEHELKLGGAYTKYNYKRYSYTGINALNSKIGQDSTLADAVALESDRVLQEVVTGRLSSWIGYDPLGRDWNTSEALANEYDLGDEISLTVISAYCPAIISRLKLLSHLTTNSLIS